MIKQFSMAPIDYNNPNKFWTQEERDFYKGMSDAERIAATILRIAYTCIGILVAVLLCALLSGCTTTKYVTVPEYHTDTLRLTQYERDSIYVHDSTYIKEAGDTVRIERWHTKYIEKQVHDTIYQSRTDSVPKPYPFVKVVERELTTNQKVLMILGAVALMAFIVWIIFKLKRFLI